MNNVKRLFLGIAAIALTLSFSAFKEVKTEKASFKFAPAYYGWHEIDQEYKLLPGLPDNEQCEVVGEEICSVVIDTDAPAPTMTSTEAQTAGAQPYDDATTGSYFNPER